MTRRIVNILCLSRLCIKPAIQQSNIQRVTTHPTATRLLKTQHYPPDRAAQRTAIVEKHSHTPHKAQEMRGIDPAY
jgi:hypothetical protein